MFNEAHHVAVDAIKKRPKKWMGMTPVNCDICHDPLVHQFVDGATMHGPWAIMCFTCHLSLGCGLGTGRDQIYDLKTLEKIDG